MNPNHGSDGKFVAGSSAAAGTGDHAAVSPSLATRNVSGRAVPRAVPVTRHANAVSLGTEKPMSAREERVALNRRADESLYHSNTKALPANRDLIGTRIAPGRLDPRTSVPVSVGSGAKPRVRVKATRNYGL
jgi:hypothetical protein